METKTIIDNPKKQHFKSMRFSDADMLNLESVKEIMRSESVMISGITDVAAVRFALNKVAELLNKGENK